MTEPGHVMTHKEFLRLRIVETLRTTGGASRHAIAEAVGSTGSAVQTELDALQKAGKATYVRASRYQVTGRWVLAGA